MLGNSAVREGLPEGRRRALIGRDTRVSGDFLASALCAGMSAGGFDVIDAGIIPTPGVAFLTSVLNVEMGAVISASHNPMPDNGIKFFARGGFKLPDSKEDDIEAVLGQDWDRPTGAGVGRVSHETVTATNLYIDHLVSTIAPLNPDKTQPAVARPEDRGGLRERRHIGGRSGGRCAAPARKCWSSTPPRTDTTSTRTPVPRTPSSCRPWSRPPTR